MSGYTLTPDMLMALQALGQMPNGMGLGAMPGMAQSVLDGSMNSFGPGGPGGPQGTPVDGAGFPINPAIMAGLGAAGLGLRQGAQVNAPRPLSGLPVASQPGRGAQMQSFSLGGGRR